METRKWWTVRQIAAYYGLSVRSVYDMIERGQLIAHRFGAARGALRIADEDRKEWEQGSRQQNQGRSQRRAAPAPEVSSLIEKHLRL